MITLSLVTRLIHFLSYNISWVSCIAFAALNQAYTGPAITLIALVLQVSWQRYHGLQWKAPLIFACYLGLLGALVDTFWLHQNLIIFQANPFGLRFSPLWMICLWLSFGFNLIVTIEPYLHYYKMLGLLIFVSLPFSYWVGIQTGAATLISGNSFYLYLGSVWAILLPLNLYIYQLWRHRREA